MLDSQTTRTIGRWIILALIVLLIAKLVLSVVGPLLPVVVIIWAFGKFYPKTNK